MADAQLLLQEAEDSVDALVRHAALTPSEVLPRGPLTHACRRALRAALACRPAVFGGALFEQQRFLEYKLLPPARWRVVGNPANPRRVRAQFVGVLPELFTVHMWWDTVQATSDRPHALDLLHVEVSCGERCIWSHVVDWRMELLPVRLDYHGPCPATVVACVRALLIVDTTCPRLEPYDRFFAAVRDALTVRDTWAAVTQAVQFGMCGAAVVPGRVRGRVVFARWSLSGDVGSKFLSQLWVLVAAGAKPRALLSLLITKMDTFAEREAAAAGLLAGADMSRPVWDNWVTLKYRFPANNMLFYRVRDAWPLARVCVDLQRHVRWTLPKAVWCLTRQ
jgi:hypothetical protein